MPTAPRIRTQGGVPTVPDTVEFLDRVQAVRNVFPGIPGLPEVPRPEWRDEIFSFYTQTKTN